MMPCKTTVLCKFSPIQNAHTLPLHSAVWSEHNPSVRLYPSPPPPFPSLQHLQHLTLLGREGKGTLRFRFLPANTEQQLASVPALPIQPRLPFSYRTPPVTNNTLLPNPTPTPYGLASSSCHAGLSRQTPSGQPAVTTNARYSFSRGRIRPTDGPLTPLPLPVRCVPSHPPTNTNTIIGDDTRNYNRTHRDNTTLVRANSEDMT